MKTERTIQLDGQVHSVLISDEPEALKAAKAAGGASIGLWDRNREAGLSGGGFPGADLSAADYLAERLEDIDERYLEQVVRRHLGLPWILGESERLVIREFCLEDAALVPGEPQDGEADRIFYTPERLKEYIRCQYGFFEYGIWALVEKESRRLVGKAGLMQPGEEWQDFPEGLEMGYHIFEPYRGRGYGLESCRWILSYVQEWYQLPVYVKIDPSNERSIHLAMKCGFQFSGVTEKRCNGEIQRHNRYVWYCPQRQGSPVP